MFSMVFICFSSIPADSHTLEHANEHLSSKTQMCASESKMQRTCARNVSGASIASECVNVEGEAKGKAKKRKSNRESELLRCEQCGNKYTRMSRLREHIRRKHARLNRPLVCQLCTAFAKREHERTRLLHREIDCVAAVEFHSMQALTEHRRSDQHIRARLRLKHTRLAERRRIARKEQRAHLLAQSQATRAVTPPLHSDLPSLSSL